ncbi:MAG: heme o synthase [Bacillota bacterium]
MLRIHRSVRLLALAALHAFAAVAAGGLPYGELPGRAFSLMAGLLTLAALILDGRLLWSRRAGLAANTLATLALSVMAALAYTTPAGVGLSILTVLQAAVAWGVTVNPHPSRLAMFRSQWQVPLYAALATFLVINLGGYLKSVGAGAACTTWPLCSGPIPEGLEAVVFAHLAHRAAAGLAGLFLLYTALFVVRRHQRRPLLLVLAGVAIVLFGTQVALGAQAALQGPLPLGSLWHTLTATAFMGVLVILAVAGYYAPSLPSISGAEVDVLPAVRPIGAVVRDYLMTTKPRILVLLLITGFAGMWVAQGGMPDLALTLVTLTGLGMSCGGANAVNMWFDQDIDAVMSRTKKRPIPAGKLTGEQVLAFGIMMGALSFLLLAAAVNLMTAALSLGGYLFYTVVYTMWLKRNTSQNIVIGGAAGAVPPLVGWAAVTGEVSWAAVIMFLIVFIWTPPHFWALALFRGEDYARAGVPMLPVVKGERHTKWQILLYSLLLIPTGMLLYWTGTVGEVYLWVSGLLGLSMVLASLALLRERLPKLTWAHRTFGWSILYLALIFLAMALDVRG